MEWEIGSDHTWVEVIYSKQEHACCHCRPFCECDELGGKCATSSPARTVAFVNGGIDGLLLLIDTTDLFVGAHSED